MGRIEFGGREHIDLHENTETEYYDSVSAEIVESRLRNITDILSSGLDRICYVVGMGAHPKATYQELKTVDGVEVVWSGSMLPIFARILGGVVASYAGLVKIEDPTVLRSVMEKLMRRSMAGVYVISQSLEQQFIDRVTIAPVVQGIDFDVKVDPAYFFYVVDADNGGSETGIVEIVSYGRDAGVFKQLF